MEAASFRLEEQTAKYGGTKLWTLTLDVPGEKVNKIGPKLLQDFEATMTELETLGSQGKIDALVLVSGKPGNFIAGADIEMLAGVKTTEQAITMCMSGHALCNRWEDLPYPTVAAVDGAALGGGCELALACTLRIASETARLGQPEVKLGLIPGYGGTQRLPRLVGPSAALKLILTGDIIPASEALRIGLVDEVVAAAALLDHARALALKIAAQAPLAVAAAMEVVRKGADIPLGEALALEAIQFGWLSRTVDKHEGVDAFLAKRPANFTGQ